ncbi:MAG: J domain-containing protein [Bacteroidales bacterium]
MTDYYKILGIPHDAHNFEVRRAFRDKAKSLHPDLNPDKKAHEDFKKINEAYHVLSNAEKRRTYDMRLNNKVPSIRVYYSPGNVYYRKRSGQKYRYNANSESKTEYEKFEKYFDFLLFITLVFIGCFSLIYGLYRLWYNPIESINPYPGIAMGIFFTSLLIFIWRYKNKLSSKR